METAHFRVNREFSMEKKKEEDLGQLKQHDLVCFFFFFSDS